MTASTPAVRLAAALAAALIVGGGTWRHMSRLAEKAAGAGPRATVMVARKAVPAGRPFAAEMAEPRVVPADYAEPGAFSRLDDIKALAGPRTRIPLSAGEQLTRSKFESENARLGLAWIIPPGLTGVGVRLNPEQAAGGHVLPGDWVRVLAVEGRNGPAGAIVEKARVIAVNERTWDPAGAPPSPQSALGGNEPILVTLLLTPGQSARVATATERGRLTLALRSPIDDERP